MTLDDIKQEFRLTYDNGDPWGSAMQWAFSVAEESYFNRNGDAAFLLQYGPGAGTPDPSDNYGHDLLGQLSDADLYRFAGLLSRFLDMCKRRGLDY